MNRQVSLGKGFSATNSIIRFAPNMQSHHMLSLNGEIQKQGHIDFEKKDRKNPDFVFHVPGTHEHNTLIVEVKGKIVDEIKKDFTTLLTFVNKYDYRAGIFICIITILKN